jgi:hypothetical protein
MLGEVDQADLNEQYIHAGSSRVPYDYLILAPGAVDNYFGHKEWHSFAPGMKEVEDATLIRSRMLLSFETAEIESDPGAGGAPGFRHCRGRAYRRGAGRRHQGAGGRCHRERLPSRRHPAGARDSDRSRTRGCCRRCTPIPPSAP